MARVVGRPGARDVVQLAAARARFFFTVLFMGTCWPAIARGADYELALEQTDLAPDPGGPSLYFGTGVAGGDFDGDGYADLAVGAFGRETVYLYSGSPRGLDPTYSLALLHRGEPTVETFGGELSSLDSNADGYGDLVVSAGDSDAVFIYQGGPAGLAPASEYRVRPAETSFDPSDSIFGAEIEPGGDTDGDGFPELLVGDADWRSDADSVVGAIFVYPGSDMGFDSCNGLRLAVTDRPESGEVHLGYRLSGDGDLNGDGYSDIASSCYQCGELSPDGNSTTGKVFTWMGGLDGAGRDAPTEVLDCCDVHMLPDIDGDGFDELAVTSYENQSFVYYGGSEGLDAERLRRLGDPVSAVSGLGDVDGDGLGDVLLGIWGGAATVGLVFGSIERPDDPPWLVLEHPVDGIDYWGIGDSLHALGDINGDGHGDFAAAAYLANQFEGSLSVYSPICTWYADLDADGHGDPATPRATCHDPGAGWARDADDCDDTDSGASGSTWYADADGDGYGTRSGSVLACTQPAGSSTSWHDCDDQDAARSPGVADVDVDGVDQDCDGHDGLWDWDTGDCPEDTAASAEDSADDTAAKTGEGSEDSADPDCGCASGSGAGGFALALSAAAAARRPRLTSGAPGR